MGGGWLLKTLTLLCRADAYKVYAKDREKYDHPQDIYMQYHLLKQGRGLYICQNMGVYHRWSGSFWNGKGIFKQTIANYECLKELYSYNSKDYTVVRRYQGAIAGLIAQVDGEVNRIRLISESIRAKWRIIDLLRLIYAILVFCRNKVKKRLSN